MIYSHRRPILLFLPLLLLSGCAGTKVLKEKHVVPYDDTQVSLATAEDGSARASLDWVIFRGGPGTWAKNAYWDQYLLRVENVSDQPIVINRVFVVDQLGVVIDTADERRELVRASKKVVRRYRKAGLKAKAGMGEGAILLGGTLGSLVGIGYGLSGVSNGIAAAGTAGLVLAAPAALVVSTVRAYNKSKVINEIRRRRSTLPASVNAAETTALTLFFPLAPSPRHVVIEYATGGIDGTLTMDVAKTLDGLHLDTTKQQRPRPKSNTDASGA